MLVEVLPHPELAEVQQAQSRVFLDAALDVLTRERLAHRLQHRTDVAVTAIRTPVGDLGGLEPEGLRKLLQQALVDDRAAARRVCRHQRRLAAALQRDAHRHHEQWRADLLALLGVGPDDAAEAQVEHVGARLLLHSARLVHQLAQAGAELGLLGLDEEGFVVEEGRSQLLCLHLGSEPSASLLLHFRQLIVREQH